MVARNLKGTKTMKTRKAKTTELKRLLAEGPHLCLSTFGVAGKPALTVEQETEVSRKIKNWLDTWVEPLCADLIKEWQV